MITAITSNAKTSTALVDEKFGRCSYFAIHNHTTGETNFIDNPYKNDKGGVGSSVVEMLANKEVTQIVAIEFGPKAKNLLEKLNIQMIVPEDKQITIEKIIEKIK
jgi:predicted Fe-Mo cluster-binding NifX family protein